MIIWGFPGGSVVGKESAWRRHSCKRCSSIPGLGRSYWEGNGNSLQYFCLDNPMNRGAWGLNPCGASELWCWRRLLRVPWTARRSNQLIQKEINPEYSLEGLMLKLKLQYFGHLMQRADSLEKALILGKIEGKRRGWQRMRWLEWHHWLSGHEFEQIPGDGEGQGSLVCCSPWARKESDMKKKKKRDMTEWLNNNKYVYVCTHKWNESGWTQTDLVLAPSITSCVIWGKLLHLSACFLICQMGTESQEG